MFLKESIRQDIFVTKLLVYGEVRRLLLPVLLGLALLFCLIFLLGSQDDIEFHRLGSIIINIVVIVLFGWLGFSLIRSYPILLLTPLPMLFGYFVLIFGVGPLIHFYGSEEVLSRIRFKWHIDDESVFQVQVVNLVGMIFLVVGLMLAMSSSPAKTFERSISPALLSSRQLKTGFLVFFIIAVVLRLTFWISGVDLLGVLPGFLKPAGKVGWLSILFAAILSGRGSIKGSSMLLFALALEVAHGALTLDRYDILMPIMLAFVGVYLGGGKIRVLLIGVLIVAFSMVLLRPIISLGRDEVWSRKSQSSAEYLSSLVTDGDRLEKANQQSGDLGWWSRLNYTPVQNILIKEYDSGRSGNTYSSIYWFFLPRFLFPDKPIMDHGRQLTIIVFGHRNSSTGATVFGEAYWNGGWLSLILTSMLYGIFLWVISLKCLWLFSQSSIITWPIAIYGMLMGSLVSNFFTSGVIGSFVIFMGLVTLYHFYSNYVSGDSRRLKKVNY